MATADVQDNRLLSRCDIARISPHIAGVQFYHFATAYLNLSDLQFSNSSGILQTATFEVALKCLLAWQKSRKPHYTARELQEILITARKNGLQFDQNLINSLNNKTELTIKDLSKISRGFSARSWDIFVRLHFDFDTAPTMGMFPIQRQITPENQAMKVLETWINTDYRKRSDLKNALVLAVEDGLYDESLLRDFYKILE